MISVTASLVSGSSVLLAAFGFYYNAVRERIDAAVAVGDAPASPDAAAEAGVAIRAGRRTAWILGLVALMVFGLLGSYLVSEIEAAVDVRFAPSHYSTLDAIFVVLAFAWLGIALQLGCRAIGLSRKLKRVENAGRNVEG